MYAFRGWRWSALAVAFVLAVSAARAGLITPDSIPNPPSAVDSANGTQVYANNLVNTQYAGLGFSFADTAITHLNGVAVWAPVALASGDPPMNSHSSAIDYYNSWVGGSFVSPGSSNPTTVSSLSVETIGGQPGLWMSVYGLNGQQLDITPALDPILGVGNSGSPSGMIWTFTGSGISSFTVSVPIMVPLSNTSSSNPAWGVAGISFNTTATPEPSSLVLAGLGALGLAARFGWRRTRMVA